MSNSHDEIKNLLKASRNMLSSKKTIEESYNIKKKYGILTEADNITQKINVAKSIEKDTEQSYEEDMEETPKKDKSVTYRISGGLLKINGKSSKELQLTEDEKIGFQETMDEFVEEVSSLVDFNELNIYGNDVTWSGNLNDFNLEFDFRVGEENGIYFKVENLSKLTDETLEVLDKLKKYYNKFKSKWGKLLGNRKMTKVKENE